MAKHKLQEVDPLDASHSLLAGSIPPGNPAPSKWRVSLPYHPPLVVDAPHEAEAWKKFKAHYNIEKTILEHTVEPVSE